MVRIGKSKIKYKGKVEDIRDTGDSIVILVSILDSKGNTVYTTQYSMAKKDYEKLDNDEFRKLVSHIVRKTLVTIERIGMEVEIT